MRSRRHITLVSTWDCRTRARGGSRVDVFHDSRSAPRFCKILNSHDRLVMRVECRRVTLKRIRWGWILIGGFLAELAIFIMVIPLSLVAGQESLLYSAPPASFVAPFLLGMWVA